MSKLYEITSQYLVALEQLEVDEETGEISGYEALESVQGNFEEKAENIALYIKDELAMESSIKAERMALAEREKSHKRKAESLKRYLVNSMSAVGKAKLETPKVKLSFRKSVSTEVDDLNLIPKDFIRTITEEKPDLTAIKKAIQAGQEIPGARLEEKQNLQIR